MKNRKIVLRYFSLLHRGNIKDEGLFGTTYPLTIVEDVNLTGVACVDMVLRYFSRNLNDDLAEQQKVNPNSEDLHTVGRKAESQGLMTRLVRLNADSLNALNVPAVYEDPEFGLTVIYQISGSGVLIADPIRGIKRLPRDDFVSRWNCEALSLTVAPDFGAVGDKAAGLIKQFLPLMKPHRGLIARIIFITILVQLAGVLPPVFYTSVNRQCVSRWRL